MRALCRINWKRVSVRLTLRACLSLSLSLRLMPTDGAMRTRRETHRAIERRRRDLINSGIDDLAQLVPGAPVSKGLTLQRAVDYLRHVHAAQERHNAQWATWTAQATAQLATAQTQLRGLVAAAAAARGMTADALITPALAEALRTPVAPPPPLQLREEYAPPGHEDERGDADADGDAAAAPSDDD
jgi:hypothetical protein